MANSTLIFIASLAGIFAYFTDYAIAISVFFGVLLIIGLGVTVAAYRMTKHHPVAVTWMFQVWSVVPLTFIFLGAYGSAWLSLNLLDHLPITFSNDPNLAEDVKARKATLESLTITAITTLLAAVVLDAARDPESSFWPSERHKRSLKSAYYKNPVFSLNVDLLQKTEPDKREIKHAIEDLAAAYIEPKTKDNKAKGWSFKARLHRAKVIKTALSTLDRHGMTV